MSVYNKHPEMTEVCFFLPFHEIQIDQLPITFELRLPAELIPKRKQDEVKRFIPSNPPDLTREFKCSSSSSNLTNEPKLPVKADGGTSEGVDNTSKGVGDEESDVRIVDIEVPKTKSKNTNVGVDVVLEQTPVNVETHTSKEELDKLFFSMNQQKQINEIMMVIKSTEPPTAEETPVRTKKNYKVADLKEICKKHGIDSTGKKDELMKRLTEKNLI